jgi:hypothetical protein
MIVTGTPGRTLRASHDRRLDQLEEQVADADVASRVGAQVPDADEELILDGRSLNLTLT